MKNRNNNEDSPKTNWVPEPGHRFPVTRRELLAQGFIGFSGMLALPSLVGLSFKSAYAADCGAQTGTPVKLPFMAFDMAGGASFPGNFLVGKEGDPENYLGSYNILGWDPKETGALNKDFGLPMSAKYSKLLEGFLAGCTSADARKNFQMGSFLHGAQDDSTTNKMNAGTLVLRSSQPGLFIGTGLCLRKSASGGNSEPLINDLALKPTYIEDLLDLSSATKFGGAPYSSLSAKQLKALADGSLRLGTIQASALSAYPEGSILQDLSKCAYKKSLEFLNGITGLDPRNDTSVAPVYGLNANTNTRDANALSAAVAMNSIKGTAGPGVWTLGDCDYHTGSQTKGDQRDREMGVEIGRAVEIAFRLKRPFFFQINKIHLAQTGNLWIWISDAMAIFLLFVAVSGLFLLKGKYGLKGRGLWLTGLGIIIPLAIILLYLP